MNTFGQKLAATRTEDDILSQQPIILQLGKHGYAVAPLTILKNKAWRNKVAATLNDLAMESAPQLDNMQAFMGGFMAMFFNFPERVLDLVLAYAPDIPRDHVEAYATDEEVVIAFSRVLAVAYPFFGLLGTMQEMAKASGSATTHQR